MIYTVKRKDTGQFISAAWVLRGADEVWTDRRDASDGVSGAARLNENDAQLMIEWQRENGIECERQPAP